MHKNHKSVSHYITIDVNQYTGSNDRITLTLRLTSTRSGRAWSNVHLDHAKKEIDDWREIYNAPVYCRHPELAEQLRLRGVELDQ
jgi:hypothetical protein